MKKYLMTVIVAGTLVLAGCSSSPEKQLNTMLNEMNKAEEEYESIQKELVELEQSEQQLFNEIMELTQDEQEEVDDKVSEIEAMLQERLTYIEEEEAAMQKSKEATESFGSITEGVNDADEEVVEQLKLAINNRYDAHAEFTSAYTELGAQQKELYKLLISEETDITKLTEQVEKVNAQNEIVENEIKGFNDATSEVNKLKEDALKRISDD